jgi:hypothetical protein
MVARAAGGVEASTPINQLQHALHTQHTALAPAPTKTRVLHSTLHARTHARTRKRTRAVELADGRRGAVRDALDAAGCDADATPILLTSSTSKLGRDEVGGCCVVVWGRLARVRVQYARISLGWRS